MSSLSPFLSSHYVYIFVFLCVYIKAPLILKATKKKTTVGLVQSYAIVLRSISPKMASCIKVTSSDGFKMDSLDNLSN